MNVLKNSESPIANLNFLLLEDMDSFRNQMIKDLRDLGVVGKIFEAPDVATAIKMCNTEEFDFIISDWNLPDGTGHDFLKKVRATAKFKKTPFMMCTTNDEIGYILQAIASGANDFLVKPWKQEELSKKLALILGKSKV